MVDGLHRMIYTVYLQLWKEVSLTNQIMWLKD